MICPICKQEFAQSDLLKQETSGMYFCKKDFSNGTIIIGLMEYSKQNPDYIHPALPKPITKDMNFELVLKIYQTYIGELN